MRRQQQPNDPNEKFEWDMTAVILLVLLIVFLVVITMVVWPGHRGIGPEP